MLRRALILGVGGQDGSYLAELLLSRGYEVHGVYRHSSTDNLQRIAHLRDRKGLTLHRGDVLDIGSIRSVLSAVCPHELYNEADQDNVDWSYATPGYTSRVTGLAVADLLETVRKTTPACRVFQPVSATMFGDNPPPQNEDTPFDPRSPYACAKVYAYHLCRYYRKCHGLFVSTGILFNHDSPRRGPGYLLHRICREVIEQTKNYTGGIKIGNPDTVLDVGHACDYVDAISRTLQVDEPNDYVIGTGRGVPVSVLCGMACDVPDLAVEVVPDPDFNRPQNSPTLVADPAKALRVLGWKAETPVRELVRQIYRRYQEGGA